MNLVFVCLRADTSDPVHATAARWIEMLAAQPEIERLTVLALDAGRMPARDNLIVHAFRGCNRLHSLVRLYAGALRAIRSGADAFFVYQGGPYPVLLWPLRVGRGVPLYYWKAHPQISRWTRLSARAATKVFTSTPAAFPMALPHLVVVGQGVDLERFTRPSGVAPERELVTVGRIAPAKRLEVMIRAVARCNRAAGAPLRMDIYGPTLPKDGDYRARLSRLIAGLNLSEAVSFKGPVAQEDLPGILSTYRLFINVSRTALDRAVVEAMACGVPVLSTNPAVAEILPPPLRAILVVPDDDAAVAEGIERMLALSEADRARMGASLRDLVAGEHSLQRLVGRILREMGAR